MDDLIAEFLAETTESLEVIDNELVKFESDPTDRATLDNIFRLVHTIKGTCGFLGLGRLEGIAHAGETLLGKFRDGDLVADSAAVTAVLSSLDRIKEIVDALGENGVEPEGDDTDLIAQLEAISTGKAAPVAETPAEPVIEPEPEPEVAAETASDDEESPVGYDKTLGRDLRPGEVSLEDLEAAFHNTPGPDEEDNEVIEEDDDADLDIDDVPVAAAETEVTPAPAAPEAKLAADAPKTDGPPRPVSTIRVSVDVLESLMTTVSELVLARNQLHQIVRDNEDSALKTPLQRLSSVTTELQDNVMKTRMQPVGDAWRKLPRIVRDATQDLGKKINLVMEGEDTELDRQVLELIKDPLTHMVRNSADHGVENPADREAAGKKPAGTIKLSAYHEGGAIIIKIADDGAGLNAEKIRAKVIEKGLATESELAAMTEQQIQRYIFAAGFSTAAQVTNLSGRGVGMDVVRTNIEQIGGSIDLQSEMGKGTTFSIKIPLTLAIVSALIVKTGGARFAVPQLAVRELVRVGPGSDHTVENMNGAQIIRLRDRLLPVTSLRSILGLNKDEKSVSIVEYEAESEDLADSLAEAFEKDSHSDIEELNGYVITLEAAGRKIGLVVDDVLDTEEIVVKPLSGPLRSLSEYSGATLLGDGSVIMILDPNGVSQSVAHIDDEAETETVEDSSVSDPSRQRLLLIKAGGEEPKAVPVSLITRLEEFKVEDIERSDGRLVVQYRGRLLPIVHVAGEHAMKTEGRQPVLVFAEDERSAGVAVDDIIDVVEESLDLQMGSERPGVIGSAVLKGKATEVMDIAWHMEQAWSGAHQRKVVGRKSILLVEPDSFSRRMMAPLLAAAGYDVTVAGSLHEAEEAAQMGCEYCSIVGDPTALAKLSERNFWPGVPRLGISEDGGSGFDIENLIAITRPSDRGGLIAALDRAASQSDTVAA